jgi:hypothetical protein
MAVTVPMGPAVVNLTGVRAGDRNLLTVTLTSKGDPYDLTGLTLSAQARLHAVDPEPAVVAEIEVDPDPTTGKFALRWPGDQVAAAMPQGKASWSGVWDLQADDGTNDPTTLAAGSFAAVLDITRP